MGVQYVTNGREFFPQIVCDACGEPITDLHRGNVECVFDEGHEQKQTDAVYFSHKGCSHRLGLMLSAHYNRHISTAWEELHLFPIHLMYNAGMQDAAKVVYGLRDGVPTERNPINPTGLTLRYRILRRDGYRCQMCGRDASDGVKLEVDHKIPRSRGGTDTEVNLWTLCFDCNRGKRDYDL